MLPLSSGHMPMPTACAPRFAQATGGRVVLPPYRRFVALDYFALGRQRFTDLPEGCFRDSQYGVDL